MPFLLLHRPFILLVRSRSLTLTEGKERRAEAGSAGEGESRRRERGVDASCVCDPKFVRMPHALSLLRSSVQYHDVSVLTCGAGRSSSSLALLNIWMSGKEREREGERLSESASPVNVSPLLLLLLLLRNINSATQLLFPPVTVRLNTASHTHSQPKKRCETSQNQKNPFFLSSPRTLRHTLTLNTHTQSLTKLRPTLSQSKVISFNFQDHHVFGNRILFLGLHV